MNLAMECLRAMKLDLSAQAQAALDEAKPSLIMGGPGSGKTTLALLKGQALVANLEPQQRVLFLSFSRAAVRQVLVRCKDVLSPADRSLIAVKTYHAFCMEILRAHGRLLTGEQPRVMFPGPERIAKTAFDGDWPDEQQRLADVEGIYVFDQFATSAAKLLEESGAVAELVASMYPVIIVDEFQDTNDSQWEFVQLLARRSHMLFLADPDQRIFEYDPTVDPERLNQLRTALNPAEFDLGSENHRSPDAGILQFANALMRNQALPETQDVKVVSAFPSAFDATVHAAVTWSFSALRELGVMDPSVAVLARTNARVVEISGMLSTTHTYNKQVKKPVEHEVVWEAELTSAAAQVLATILEWPARQKREALIGTYEAIADYFEVKNSIRPSKSARTVFARFRTAADKVRANQQPRQQAGVTGLETAFDSGIELVGNPTVDWIAARDIIGVLDDLKELFTNVRFVRLFRATDEIGSRLMQRWRETGTYLGAPDLVRRALEANLLVADHRDPKGCLLMTVHKSKGKEFDAVVIVDGRFTGPFYSDREEKAPFLAGRRLLRVAITRARHKVVIVRPHDAFPLVD